MRVVVRPEDALLLRAAGGVAALGALPARAAVAGLLGPRDELDVRQRQEALAVCSNDRLAESRLHGQADRCTH